MRTSRDQQSLSYPLRLPDEIQADALRLLDVSREVINLTITALWDRLDEFSTRTNSYAYKQVEEMISPPLVHGHRQWRCEAEQAGRILRGQAERKQQFALILPLLSQGMIQPKTDTKRAGKNRKAIKQALADLREVNSDGGNVVELQSLIEQACNFYLQNGCFPETYEEMQPMPVLKAGLLPYAGDDGPVMGQTYWMSYDLDHKTLTVALRTPNAQGAWARTWREHTCQMQLPDLVVERAREGSPLAPSLREIVEADGTRYAVLDFIVEVPGERPAPFEDIQTVLGFDWGVRVLVTASVVDLDGHQIGRPFFSTPGRLMAGRLACAVRSTSSRPTWPAWNSNGIASQQAIQGAGPQKRLFPSCAGKSADAGASTRPETTIWRTWRPISCWCWPPPLTAS